MSILITTIDHGRTVLHPPQVGPIVILPKPGVYNIIFDGFEIVAVEEVSTFDEEFQCR